MECKKNNLLVTLILLMAPVLCNAIPVLEQEYKIEAFEKNGDAQTLVLKIKRLNNGPTSSVHRQGRQEEEEEESTNAVQSSTPFIPAVIPALTKIFTGIITGNLNEIFHGSTSFAPQNISHAIDTVYNQIVGLPVPVSTAAPTQRPLATTEPEPPAPSSPAPRPSASSSVTANQPFQGQSLIISTTKTPKPLSNEDDEDEQDVDSFGFRKLTLRRKASSDSRP